MLRRRPGANDEAGFTMPEVLITVLLLGIVSVMLLQTLTSFTTATTGVESRTFALNDSRVALETITRDLRAANPIDALTAVPITTYDNEVRFSVYCAAAGVGSCGSDNLRRVRYRLNTTDRTLEQIIGSSTRVIAGPRSAGGAPVATRPGAIVNAADEPVFKFFDHDGTQLLTAPPASASPPTQFRDCTKSVEIFLRIRAAGGATGETTDLSTRIDLRNYNEVTAC